MIDRLMSLTAGVLVPGAAFLGSAEAAVTGFQGDLGSAPPASVIASPTQGNNDYWYTFDGAFSGTAKFTIQTICDQGACVGGNNALSLYQDKNQTDSPTFGPLVASNSANATDALVLSALIGSGLPYTIRIERSGGTGVDPAIRLTITPIPAALPLLASALGALGLMGYRRRGHRYAEQGAS